MKPPAEDLEAREPVWVALGEFFLDNQPATEYVAVVCAKSSYSIDELDEILFYEVWPALSANLASYAGEWAGWDKEWLARRVLEIYKPATIKWWRLNPVKLLYCKTWFHTRNLIRAKRSNESQSHAL